MRDPGFSVYLITDRHQCGGRPLLDVLAQALEAGIRGIQVRERDLEPRALLSLSEEIGAMARRYGATVLLNDRLDIARAAGLDGGHLRANSLSPAAARRVLGAGALLGVSAHSADEAAAAAADGADFVVLGPVFETPTKRAFGPPIGVHAIEQAARRVAIPVFAIGGVTPARVPDVMRAGAKGVAVIGAVLRAPDAGAAARALLDAVAGGLYS